MLRARRRSWKENGDFYKLELGEIFKISHESLQQECTNQLTIPIKWHSFIIQQSPDPIMWTRKCFWIWSIFNWLWVVSLQPCFQIDITYNDFISFGLNNFLKAYLTGLCLISPCRHGWSSCWIGRAWNNTMFRQTKEETLVSSTRHQVWFSKYLNLWIYKFCRIANPPCKR